MRKGFLLFTLMLCMGLAGCGGVEGDVKDAIRSRLQYPISATFSDFKGPKKLEQDAARRRFPSQSVVHMQVNARNSDGEFTGKEEWVAFLDEEGKKIGTISPVVGPVQTIRAELLQLLEQAHKGDSRKLLSAKLFAERLALLGDFTYLIRIENILAAE